jgi:pyrroloquinoline quinone biosynthesis protein B
LREQFVAHPPLAANPDAGLRNSPLKAVVLTNADVDHVAGLLNLREGQPFHLYASARVLSALAANPIFDVLHEGLVRRVALADGDVFEPDGCSGLAVELAAVAGKVALYLENPDAGADFGSDAGDVVALKLRDTSTGRFACYIPGCAKLFRLLRRPSCRTRTRRRRQELRRAGRHRTHCRRPRVPTLCRSGRSLEQ